MKHRKIQRPVNPMSMVITRRLLLSVVLILLTCGCGSDSGQNSYEPDAAVFDPVDVMEISIEMPPDIWDDIRHTARSPEILVRTCNRMPLDSPFEYVPATVTVDGQTLNDVGVRTKGWWGSINPTRPSLKIEFDEFVDDQRLGDLERMTLNNNNHDPSRMHTCFAYQVFREVGYPAPECGYAHLSVNGKDFGIYSAVEPIKKSFLRKWFESDKGNLYESQISDFTPWAIDSWERKTNDDTADDRSDLEAVMAALESDNELLLPRLGELIDLDKFYTYWALEILISFWDGYNGDQNNCYIYKDPATGKFVFIPWGADDAFVADSSFLNLNSVGSLFANSAISNRLYSHPEARAKFKARLSELYETVWKKGYLQQQVSHVREALLPFISENFNPHFTAETEALQAFMDQHAGAIETELILADSLPDYPFGPTRKCFDSPPMPQPFSVSFSAVWGSEPYDGTSTVTEFIFPGLDPNNIAQASVSLHPSTEGDIGGLGNVTMQFYEVVFAEGSTDSGELFGIMFNLSPQQFQSGNVEIENLTTCGTGIYLSDFNNEATARFAGVVTKGRLQLDQVGLQPGEPVSGTFSGEIVRW